ncbi:hypothetical protein KC19_1G113100 [Ceratodon purpureus]|uniref:Nucleolus and neural progenitor protein-like N-terminal domain-containing protein n=1 Tax=Ceratodon purpureus TaxID=3225 RepID=A0A8T0J6S0_CERPU|nr:hypothetical protein KC19_1G113100 [Ceratodon purpureus]
MGKKSASNPFLPRPPACLTQIAEENFDGKKVEEEARLIQGRLKDLFTQVWDENATFQRIMYKNQNQHRRALYFRRLMQVRRDLLLLHSFGLKDVFETLPYCVSISKQKALPPKAVLGSLGQGLKSKEELVLIVQRRLLGAARLLQMMSDPILSASSVMEGLLSQSFFMPFALTVLAMLARFRVLLMQALYEMISAFNLVSAFLQKMEIASVRADVPLFIECSWDGVKLAFFEKAPPPQAPSPPEELIPLPTCVSDAANLPDVGWFIDDRSTLAKEKLQSNGALEPVLYERDESYILEDSPFELLGEEDVEETGVPLQSTIEAYVPPGIPEVELKSEIAGISAEAISTPGSTIPISTQSSVGIGQLKESLSADAKAELESWKAELESWGSKAVDKTVVEPYASDVNMKKRVAYVSIQIGGAKESKIPKTGHLL